MTPAKALATIRQCIEQEHYVLHEHFVERMSQRNLFLADVLAIVDQPSRVRVDGHDACWRAD